ncbi:hypothetical protein U1Q18_009813 [Sarracenia purpurea var. burkii]
MAMFSDQNALRFYGFLVRGFSSARFGTSMFTPQIEDEDGLTDKGPIMTHSWRSSESALGRSRLWWYVLFLRIFGEALCVTVTQVSEYGNGCGVKACGILPPNSGIITSPPLAFGVFGRRAAINLPAFGSAAKGGQLDIYLLGPACWARKPGLLV